jgi:hypothetical protein
VIRSHHVYDASLFIRELDPAEKLEPLGHNRPKETSWQHKRGLRDKCQRATVSQTPYLHLQLDSCFVEVLTSVEAQPRGPRKIMVSTLLLDSLLRQYVATSEQKRRGGALRKHRPPLQGRTVGGMSILLAGTIKLDRLVRAEESGGHNEQRQRAVCWQE